MLKIYKFQPYVFIENYFWKVTTLKTFWLVIVFLEYIPNANTFCFSIIQMSKVLIIGARLHKILGLARFNTLVLYFIHKKKISTIYIVLNFEKLVRGIFDPPSERHGFICDICFMVRNQQTFKQIEITFSVSLVISGKSSFEKQSRSVLVHFLLYT